MSAFLPKSDTNNVPLLDISHGNVALAAHPDAFTPESLKQTFGNDRTSEVTLMLLDEVSGTPPPRPINLPKYMIARDGPTLSSNVEDMSLVDIFDYGKGKLNWGHSVINCPSPSFSHVIINKTLSL